MTNQVPPPGDSRPVYHWPRLDRAYCEGQQAYIAGEARLAPQPHYKLSEENWLAGYDDAAAGTYAAYCNIEPAASGPQLQVSVPLVSDDSSVDFVRSGSAWQPDANGVYQQYGTNAPNYTSGGLYVEPAATNYCTNYNAAPDASLTNVSVSGGTLSRELDVAKLATAGLANICSSGYAFKFVNGTGSDQTITIAGSQGATNPGSISAWVRSSDRFELQLGSDSNGYAATSEYERVTLERLTPGAAETMEIIAPAGCVLYWVLNQYEAAAAGSAWGVTSPIVVAGSSASRNVSYGFYDLPAGLPTNDVLITCDFESASKWQYNLTCVGLNSNGGTNRFDFSLPNVRMINAGGSNAIQSRYIYGKARQRVGLHWDSGGSSSFCDGKKGAATGANPGPCDLSSTRVFFGSDRFGTSTTGFSGRIKSFQIYGSVTTDAQGESLTVLDDYDLQDIGKVGIPFYDNGGLWALLWNDVANNFDRIGYSNDGGQSWITEHYLDTPSLTNGALFRDRNNQFYYGGSTGLIRVDQFGNQSQVITWNVTAGGTFDYLPWAFGQRSNGELYTAPYNTSLNTGNGWFYKSTDNGATWTELNITDLFPGETAVRHLHALRVSPVDDLVYGTYGDTDRGEFTYDGTTGTALTGSAASGHTDVTFAGDGTLFLTDRVGNTNYIERITSGAALGIVREMPYNVHLGPIYNGRVQGDKLILYSRNEESGTSDKKTGIVIMDISNGIDGQLDVLHTIKTEDPLLGERDFRFMGLDQWGQIPAWADRMYLYGFTTEPYCISFKIPDA